MFDITLDNAFAQMSGVGNMTGGELAFFANVEQDERFTGRSAIDHILNTAFDDLFARLVDDRQESFGMCARHCSYTSEKSATNE